MRIYALTDANDEALRGEMSEIATIQTNTP
jgi:hypothetical protein